MTRTCFSSRMWRYSTKLSRSLYRSRAVTVWVTNVPSSTARGMVRYRSSTNVRVAYRLQRRSVTHHDRRRKVQTTGLLRRRLTGLTRCRRHAGDTPRPHTYVCAACIHRCRASLPDAGATQVKATGAAIFIPPRQSSSPGCRVRTTHSATPPLAPPRTCNVDRRLFTGRQRRERRGRRRSKHGTD